MGNSFSVQLNNHNYKSKKRRIWFQSFYLIATTRMGTYADMQLPFSNINFNKSIYIFKSGFLSLFIANKSREGSEDGSNLRLEDEERERGGLHLLRGEFNMTFAERKGFSNTVESPGAVRVAVVIFRLNIVQLIHKSFNMERVFSGLLPSSIMSISSSQIKTESLSSFEMSLCSGLPVVGVVRPDSSSPVISRGCVAIVKWVFISIDLDDSLDRDVGIFEVVKEISLVSVQRSNNTNTFVVGGNIPEQIDIKVVGRGTDGDVSLVIFSSDLVINVVDFELEVALFEDNVILGAVEHSIGSLRHSWGHEGEDVLLEGLRNAFFIVIEVDMDSSKDNHVRDGSREIELISSNVDDIPLLHS